jgi:hypothetical protein
MKPAAKPLSNPPTADPTPKDLPLNWKCDEKSRIHQIGAGERRILPTACFAHVRN